MDSPQAIPEHYSWSPQGYPLLGDLLFPSKYLDNVTPPQVSHSACLDYPILTDDGSLDVPTEIVDLFVEYASSSSDCCSPPSESYTPETYPGIPLEQPKKLYPQRNEAVITDLSPCLGVKSAESLVKKKKSNREASFRYRQKLKSRSLQLQQELDIVMSSYKRARLACEKAEETYNVVRNLLLTLSTTR